MFTVLVVLRPNSQRICKNVFRAEIGEFTRLMTMSDAISPGEYALTEQRKEIF